MLCKAKMLKPASKLRPVRTFLHNYLIILVMIHAFPSTNQ